MLSGKLASPLVRTSVSLVLAIFNLDFSREYVQERNAWSSLGLNSFITDSKWPIGEDNGQAVPSARIMGFASISTIELNVYLFSSIDASSAQLAFAI